LASAFTAEGDGRAVAEDFNIDEKDVLQAVAYEASLKASLRANDHETSESEEFSLGA
jgi:hypothetical protein